MSPADMEVFAQGLAAFTDALLILVFLAMLLGNWAGRFSGHLIAFALARWPAYRAYRRKRNRIERMEWGAYLAERRSRA